MSTETEADDDQVVLVDVDDAFHIRDEGSANWVLRKVMECRAYRERVARWAQGETLRAERQEAFLMHRFGAELEAWTREQLAKQFGKRRSVCLPAATLGFRTEPTKLVIADERALMGWCRLHLPAAIKVTENVLKSEIQNHIKNTGECPDGAEVGGGQDRFFIK